MRKKMQPRETQDCKFLQLCSRSPEGSGDAGLIQVDVHLRFFAVEIRLQANLRSVLLA